MVVSRKLTVDVDHDRAREGHDFSRAGRTGQRVCEAGIAKRFEQGLRSLMAGEKVFVRGKDNDLRKLAEK